MDIVRALLPGRRTATLDATGQVVFDRMGTYATSGAGVPVDEQTAMQLQAVWSCVSLITDGVGMLPLHTYRDAGQARIQVSDSTLVVQPHVEMTRFDWVVRMLWSLLMRGNAFAWVIERDRRMTPSQLLPLHPDEVRIIRQDGELLYRIGSPHNGITVRAHDMLHVRGLQVPGRDSVYGLSPVEYARQMLGLGLASQEFGGKFFAQGATPSGVLWTDQTLDLDTAKAYQDRWEEAHGNRNRRTAVLGGGLKWEPVTLKPEESQFLQTRGFSRSEIAGWFRVPPHLIGDVDRSTSWGTGIEEQGHQFVTFTLGPWLKRMEDGLSSLLPRGRYVKFNTAALLRGRTLERYQAYVMARQGGWMNVDEIRALEEQAPLEDDKGTDYLMPLNFAPVPPGGGAPAAVTPPSDSIQGTDEED